jgi:hypothetical protein
MASFRNKLFAVQSATDVTTTIQLNLLLFSDVYDNSRKKFKHQKNHYTMWTLDAHANIETGCNL